VIEDLFEEDIPALLSTIRDGLKNGGILVPTILGGNCTRIEATQNTI
jgi:hypothetical protein